MANYRLDGRHSISRDRIRGGKYGVIVVRCELVVYYLQIIGITDTVLRKEMPVPFLNDIDVEIVYRAPEWAGAIMWGLTISLTIEDEHVRTTNRFGRRRPDDELRYAPWTALSRLERALRYGWAEEVGPGNMPNQRFKTLQLLD